jgi:hypothetical protein
MVDVSNNWLALNSKTIARSNVVKENQQTWYENNTRVKAHIMVGSSKSESKRALPLNGMDIFFPV